MTGLVIDSSAALALLLNEPGAEAVKAVITDAVMSTVNLAEVVGYFARGGFAEVDVRGFLGTLPVAYVALDEACAYEIGMMVPATRAAGLSLGDRACLALAKRLGTKVMTADRAWSTVARAVGVQVDVIR